ncbi:MAG: ATP-dependent Clp protease ATP-binding subunit, partial [Candidatus Colwellbacteria bacterium]|nr:ATP-dependent Clp protease ATP-binding subunit [Candidatus Colwellbacteria bacterium]
MTSPEQPRPIIFDEPRLTMSPVGRLGLRIGASIFYGATIAGTGVLIASDVRSLRALGILLALFLTDRLVHISRARRTLVRLPEGAVNVADYLSPPSYRLIESCYELARVLQEPLGLVLASRLARRRDIVHALERMDVNLGAFSVSLSRVREESKVEPGEANAGEVTRIVQAAFNRARAASAPSIAPRHLFAAACLVSEDLQRLLSTFEVAPADISHALLFEEAKRSVRLALVKPRHVAGFTRGPFRARHRVMNRAWTARPTPTLDTFSTDLTDLARRGQTGFLIGHEGVYEVLEDVLSRPGNPNAMLIGEPGIGKETIVARLAFQIVKDRVPEPLFDKRLVMLSIGSLTAGATPEEVRRRIEVLVGEVTVAGNVILYIPEFHALLKAGERGISGAELLVAAMRGTDVAVIGATTPQMYKRDIESQGDVRAAFEPIHVSELSEEEATRYLVYRAVLFEREYKVTVSFKAVSAAVELAHRHLRGQLLPGSAENLLKEALADARQNRRTHLTRDDVFSIAQRKTNVPLREARGVEAAELLQLEQKIHEHLIDQEEAVTAVSRSLREYRSGLSKAQDPIASFLFVGPTGVGKTELAKTLARILFKDERFMIRFDMSEYQSKESFIRFIGAPDQSTRGALTDAVSASPYSVLLLDEFEKAHPDILNLFLQVFDDGRLTDNLGRVVSFENVLIIA